MSERDLREGIDRHLCPKEGACYLCNKARNALAEPPDLVVLLRWCYAKGTLAASRGHGDAANTFSDMISKIEKAVRLTEDGWEWVKDFS